MARAAGHDRDPNLFLADAGRDPGRCPAADPALLPVPMGPVILIT